WVRGNCDREAADPGLAAEKGWDVGIWTAAQHDEAERAWLAALPEAVELELGVGHVLFCHATPRSDEEIVTLLTPTERLAERFAKGAQLLCDGVTAEVVESKRAQGRPVIRLDVAAPRGATLAVRRSDLPPPDEDSFYVFQLVGLAVEEEGGRALGTVRDVAA